MVYMYAILFEYRDKKTSHLEKTANLVFTRYCTFHLQTVSRKKLPGQAFKRFGTQQRKHESLHLLIASNTYNGQIYGNIAKRVLQAKNCPF